MGVSRPLPQRPPKWYGVFTHAGMESDIGTMANITNMLVRIALILKLKLCRFLAREKVRGKGKGKGFWQGNRGLPHYVLKNNGQPGRESQRDVHKALDLHVFWVERTSSSFPPWKQFRGSSGDEKNLHTSCLRWTGLEMYSMRCNFD
jgi:hypothetical protein